MNQRAIDNQQMQAALELAVLGRGLVEPNPMVGCVIVSENSAIGQGWHQRYGESHAEINALKEAGEKARGATLYVSLEPCSHHGKTPPCTNAIIDAGIRRVVVAVHDPFPLVDGSGMSQLKEAGIEVERGVMEREAIELNAPFFKLIRSNCPWIIAKWAMTLDGKIATHTGSSKWISGEASREVVHQIRGRVDAIMVGAKTALRDNPMLAARPAGQRIATRIVVDSTASLPLDHQLVTTARDVPTMVVVGPDAEANRCQKLSATGCEVFFCLGKTHQQRMAELMTELAGRRMTNVLVEGGGQLLGTLMDEGYLDEVHVFISPKIVGGQQALSPIGGQGVESIENGLALRNPKTETLGPDIYITGQIDRDDGVI